MGRLHRVVLRKFPTSRCVNRYSTATLSSSARMMSLNARNRISLMLTAFVVGCFIFGQASHTAEKDVSYSKFQIWRITPRTKDENSNFFRAIQSYETEIWKDITTGTNTEYTFLVPPQIQTEIKRKFNVANVSYVVEISDLQTAINEENPVTANNNSWFLNSTFDNNKTAHRMDWTSYHRLDDIYGYLDYLADTYPKIVQLINIGASYENRTLYVVHISHPSSIPDTKPAIWIDAGVHAREWISPALATYIIHQLVEDPANEGLLLSADWYIMPVMNPDGYEYSHVKNRLWRKSRSETGSRKCRGVDLNRNFGFQWGDRGSYADPCAISFRGIKAFSEPESIATSNFILKKSNLIKLYLTLHSFGQAVLIPWGHSATLPSDYGDMLALAKSATSTFQHYKFKVGNVAALFYRASGNSADWAKSIGIKYCYTVELPAKGFILPASNILPVSQDFFSALDVFAAEVATLHV
ncbi:carboxypeptidase B-like [Daphnia pulicaria]|uniref:carboxypeptidase B-like n=1 Tax=Daphnia pulicaria TaxID=35523 RepID=UPI001EEB8DEB|nr:carboxypeptidase B-like [Daphnia pulicaria]